MTVDLAVSKDFSITEGRQLTFRWELFNMLDRANFGQQNSTIFSDATTRNASAAEITGIKGSARQMQFGLKFAS